MNAQLADVVVRSLLWTRDHYRWALYCYCLMPDHLHFACALHDDAQLFDAGARGVVPEGVLDHVARFKSFTTREFWKLGHRGKLWQKSSFDSVLRCDRTLDDVISYVLNNPVRKGLVQRWEDWPYSRVVDPWT